MIQKRMVFAKIWESKQIGKISREARLLYVGLITLADDDGRVTGDAAALRSKIFMRDDDITGHQVKSWIDEVVAAKLVYRYTVDEEDYLVHPNWFRYQNLRRDRFHQSVLPPPPQDIVSQLSDERPSDDGQASDEAPTEDGHLGAEVSKKVSKKVSNILFIKNLQKSFELFYAAYPLHKGKAAAQRKWFTLKPDDALVSAIMAAVERQKKWQRWNEEGGKYIPHAATWLHNRRWEDEERVAPGQTQAKVDKF